MEHIFLKVVPRNGLLLIYKALSNNKANIYNLKTQFKIYLINKTNMSHNLPQDFSKNNFYFNWDFVYLRFISGSSENHFNLKC